MKISQKAPPAAPTDPRLRNVQQATMAEMEHAVEVAAAPTSDTAFDLLSDLAVQQARRDLLAACVLADAACTTAEVTCKAAADAAATLVARIARGGQMIETELTAKGTAPEEWWTLFAELKAEQPAAVLAHADAVRALADAEVGRLEAIWALGDHDMRATPPEDGDPFTLASRLMAPAMRRVGKMDVPHGPWYVAAMAEVDRHGPGWDVENTKAACRALVRAAVVAKHGGPTS